jgi:hypothetical protein
MRIRSVFTTLVSVSGVLYALSSPAAFGQTDVAAPVCDHGGPYTAECNGVTSTAQLDGTGSFDPDGDPITFFWYEECATSFFVDPTSPTPTLSMDMTDACFLICTIELRVTGGGQTTKCQTTVSMQDTLPPDISCPPDITDIWGIPTQPPGTGVATATDACDPTPSIDFSDVIIPQVHIGDPEQIIKRTWTALDNCNHSSSCLQTITLLSPSGGSPLNLDVLPGSCPNLFAPTTSGTLTAILFGTPDFKIAEVVKSSLKLSRNTNPGNFVKPMQFTNGDVGSVTANQLGDCNSPAIDGLKDMRLSFNRAALVSQLGLGAEKPGTVIKVLLTGKRSDGRTFAVADQLVIQ